MGNSSLKDNSMGSEISFRLQRRCAKTAIASLRSLRLSSDLLGLSQQLLLLLDKGLDTLFTKSNKFGELGL